MCLHQYVVVEKHTKFFKCLHEILMSNSTVAIWNTVHIQSLPGHYGNTVKCEYINGPDLI